MSKKIPNISNLHNEKNVKEQARNEMFNVVLNKCIDDITYTNKFTDKTYIVFEVPDIIIGFNGGHRYDKMSCITYLIQQFTLQKYMVQFIEPYYIYIDWGTNIDKKVDYIQKIIPTSNPTKLKKQTDELLKKYPNTSKVTYVYEDVQNRAGINIKKNKKK